MPLYICRQGMRPETKMASACSLFNVYLSESGEASGDEVDGKQYSLRSTGA